MKKKRKTKEEKEYDKLIDSCFSDLGKYADKHFSNETAIPFRIQIYTAICSLFDKGYCIHSIKEIISEETKLAKGNAIERIQGTKH